MNTRKMGTVAIVLSPSRTESEAMDWLDTLSDEQEIFILEEAIDSGNHDPLQSLYESRIQASKNDEEFGNYVEELLSKQFSKPEIQAHAVSWLKSKNKLDVLKDQELAAAEVIAEYALERYKKNKALKDFILSGPGVEVRVKILEIKKEAMQLAS